MMYLRSTAVGSMLLAPLLWACCPPCASTDGSEYLSLAFSTDSSHQQGFRYAELRSVYLVRYFDDSLTSPLDTLYQPHGLQIYWPQGMLSLLPVYAPPSSGITMNQVRPRGYRLMVPKARRSYDISDLEVQLSETECGCAQATLAEFRLNGQVVRPGRGRVVMLQK